MKLTNLLTLNALLALVFGIAFSIYAPLMAAFFGIPQIPEGNVLLYWNLVSFARMFGAALFGFGILVWSLRSIESRENLTSETRRGIIFALLIANILAFFVALTQQWAIWANTTGWLVTGLFALLSLAYSYFLVTASKG